MTTMQDSHVQLEKLQEFLSSKELSNAEHMTLNQKLLYILSSKNFMEEITKSLLTESDGAQEDKDGHTRKGPTLNREILLLLPPKDRAKMQKKLDLYAGILKETMDALNQEDDKTQQEDAKKQDLLLKQQNFLAYYQEVFEEMMSRNQNDSCNSQQNNEKQDSNLGESENRNISRITAVMDEDEDDEIEDIDNTLHSAPNNSEMGDISEEVARATDDYIEQMMKFLQQSKKFDSYMDGAALRGNTPESHSGLQVIEDDDTDDDGGADEDKVATTITEGGKRAKTAENHGDKDVEEEINVDVAEDDEGQLGNLPSCKVTLEYDKNGELVSTGSGPGEVLKRKLNNEIIKALESFKMDYTMEDDIAGAIVDSIKSNHGFLKNMNEAAIEAMSDEPNEKSKDQQKTDPKLDDSKNDKGESVQSTKEGQQETKKPVKAENNPKSVSGSDTKKKDSTKASASEGKDRHKNVVQKSGKSGKNKKKKKRKKKNKSKKENHAAEKHSQIADPNSTWICEFCEFEKVFGSKPYALMEWFDKKLEALDNTESYRRRKIRRGKARRNGKRNAPDSQTSSRLGSPSPPPPPPPPGSPPRDSLPINEA